MRSLPGNPKFESRNPQQSQTLNAQNQTSPNSVFQTFCLLGDLYLLRISNFLLRD